MHIPICIRNHSSRIDNYQFPILIECRKNTRIWAEANLSSLLLILLVRSNSDSILYQLKPKRVRIDSTTASGYWTMTEEGLFQFGESPDLPQLKVMLSVLGPLARYSLRFLYESKSWSHLQNL